MTVIPGENGRQDSDSLDTGLGLMLFVLLVLSVVAFIAT